MTRAPYKKLPPLGLLNNLFEIACDSPSGLRWRNPQANCVKIGAVAGTRVVTGYWRITITTNETSKKYFAHRIIYYMQTGEDPGEYQIDHVDCQSDNLNIRKATPTQNKGNTRKITSCKTYNSSSQYKGVTKRKLKTGVKWEASLMYNHKCVYIGRFDAEFDAAAAYNEAALALWGKFARLNELE